MNRVTLANGIALDVVDEGPTDAPALIFLHGFPESHRTWRHQIAHLKDRFRCVAPDQRVSYELEQDRRGKTSGGEGTGPRHAPSHPDRLDDHGRCRGRGPADRCGRQADDGRRRDRRPARPTML